MQAVENLTGTARGLLKAGASTRVIGASVDLTGLHMASDAMFNRKSFTTGHTGLFPSQYGLIDLMYQDLQPALRYMERYVTVSQGSVFYMTEAYKPGRFANGLQETHL